MTFPQSATSSIRTSRNGMTLLNVVILLVLIGALVLAGYTLVGPAVKRGKINDTKRTLDSNVHAIISWAVAHGRLPTQAEFQPVLANPNDAWGTPFIYLYDEKLALPTAAGFGGICGRSSTTTYNGQELAFVLISAGEDYSTESTPKPAAPPAQAFSGPPALQTSDLVRIVTLNELKAKAGCAGYTQGRLRIVNNELPNACSGSTNYNAVLTADGGSSGYTWSVISPGWVSIDNMTVPGKISFSTVPSAGMVTVRVTDSQGNYEQRAYSLKVVSCSATGYEIPVGTPPDPPVPGTSNPGFDTTNPDLIAFGLNNTNSAGCVWYPQNLPLFGKTMRAYWSFCYAGIDSSATSSNLADGYTFGMMQASNPTSYCGTSTTYNAVTNPRFDCSVWGGAGEYLAYCGLPGNSTALEFDIYPSGNRNDPAGSYNHIAIVNAYNHTTGTLTGLFGDNTHNRGGNPACTTTSTGCLYDAMTGHAYPVNWLENTGCNAARNNHNARVEVHTRCNSDCSQCNTGSCTTKTLTKVWIDRGNSSLDSNDTTTPDLSYCTDQPANLAQYRVGFTEATGGSTQYGYIKNFSLKSVGACPLASITPDVLPNGIVGVPYSASLSATGGTPPYSWGWSASNIPGISASNLPPGLTLSAAGIISGTPSVAGTYNTILVSLSDACTADGCTNTVSKTYRITVTTPPAPTCTLTANPTIVAYGGTTNFSWSITNGPANLTWSTAPGGTCTNTANSTGGSCTSGILNSPGTTIYTLTVSNAGGSTTCSATVNVGCANYRVWNETNNRFDFLIGGSCRNSISDGDEISTTVLRLLPGQTITRFPRVPGNCRDAALGQISYDTAMYADIAVTGGDGDCRVNYLLPDAAGDR